MVVQNLYWSWDKSLSRTFCDDIIKFAKSKRKDVGRVFDPTSKKTRNSNIVWFHNEKWIYRELQHYLIEANKNAEWNFDVASAGSCQFTIYENNQYYDWHVDMFSKPQKQNTNRKISLTLCLSDSDEYEGGDLQFSKDNHPEQEKQIITCKNFRNKGSVVLFPSFVWHRVTPVTKGKRCSLVIWFNGPSFK